MKRKIAVLATGYCWNRTKAELKLVCIRFLAMLQPVEIAKQRGISVQKFMRAVIVRFARGKTLFKGIINANPMRSQKAPRWRRQAQNS